MGSTWSIIAGLCKNIHVNPQNVLLLTPKVHYCGIFQPAIPETCQKYVYTVLCRWRNDRRWRELKIEVTSH